MIKTLNVSGIYKITNTITGDFYIGASVDIRMRYRTHMGRDARDYCKVHKFYEDIITLGKDKFIIEILKECDKGSLLEWEQYYYDLLKPTYNKVRPARYIDETTSFKGKNKASKIKAVCDGERKSAYGYNWKYSKV